MNTEPEINALIRTTKTPVEEVDAAEIVVTKRGELIKNRNGKTAPENFLCCTLSKMTVTPEAVHLHFPPNQCCDMKSALTLSTCASPTITLVQTWSGKKKDTSYVKSGDEWRAILPPREC
jgi:hypothetical protein